MKCKKTSTYAYMLSNYSIRNYGSRKEQVKTNFAFKKINLKLFYVYKTEKLRYNRNNFNRLRKL